MPLTATRKQKLLKRANITESDLIARYQAGFSLKDLRRITGLSEATLTRLLRSQSETYVADSRRWQLRRRRAFVLYIRTHSLRQAAKRAGVRFETLSAWFRAMHPNYATLARAGTFASVSSFLKRERNPRAIAAVEAWLISELPTLISFEGDMPVDSYTEERCRSQTRRQVSRYVDYRDGIDFINRNRR
jgi:transcriptional regulator with XRE-family HTH domain